jgi:hypothetical protein
VTRTRRRGSYLAAALAVLAVILILHAVGWFIALAAVAVAAYLTGATTRRGLHTAANVIAPAPAPGPPAADALLTRRHAAAVTERDKLRERNTKAASDLTRVRGERDQARTDLAAARANVLDLGKQVAKLDGIVGGYDDQITELEKLAARPLDAIIASYKLTASRHGGPAAHSPTVAALLADPLSGARPLP